MHLFKGLQGNRVNLFEKASRPLEKPLLEEAQPVPASETFDVKSQSASRLRSLDRRPKRREKENHSLNKIPQPMEVESRQTGLYRVKEEQESEMDRPKEGREQSREPRRLTKKESQKPASTKIMSNKELPNISWGRLEAYYRYYPIQAIAVAGERQEFLRQLSEGSLKVIGQQPPKRQAVEAYEKLLKYARLKGKYRYRQRHNPHTSEQLRSISYKPGKRQPSKKKKDESESESEEDDKASDRKYRDLSVWKKSMGVDGKVFIVKGGYRDLKNALLERGWVENPDKYSKLFDLKWTTKINDIDFQELQPKQLVNHFDANACLTSKYGLCKSIRTILYNEGVDVDRFFPRCYDLADLTDFQNFLENYKWTHCESLLKQFVATPEVFERSEHKIAIALAVTERRLADLQTNVDHVVSSKSFNVCSPEEWLVLTDADRSTEVVQRLLKKYKIAASVVELKPRVEQCLRSLKAKDPQYDLTGSKSIWILKPNYLSRGRGIKCSVKLPDILDHCISKELQYVVQKYIENPLIILQRKFDIRQWVLIEEYSKVWFYEESYLRFCAQPYDMNNVSNRFQHLTNNSIQKYSKEFNKSEIEGNMITSTEFAGIIGKENWEELQKRIKEIVVLTIKATEDQVAGRRNSFELFGYDFMVDNDLRPWLIEVNSSPAMDYSTPVTKRLVKMVLQDTVKVMVDSPKKRAKNGTGLFRCIYKSGDAFKSSYSIN